MKLTSLVCLVLVLAACGGSAAGFSTPEVGARAYFQAVLDGDTTAVRAMTAPAGHDPAYNMGEEEAPEPIGDIESFTILGTVKHGDFAIVDADVVLNDGTTHLYRLMFNDLDGKWMLGRRAWLIDAERR
ncbi:MAG: hypothetical protein KDB90_12565 [Planctomycetes bacterium]|nr:hypothetical protein [Planctomycetota bacterium]